MHTKKLLFATVVPIFKYANTHKHLLHTIQSLNKFSKTEEESAPVVKQTFKYNSNYPKSSQQIVYGVKRSLKPL